MMERNVKNRALKTFRSMEMRRASLPDPGMGGNFATVLERLSPANAVLLAGVLEYLSEDGSKVTSLGSS